MTVLDRLTLIDSVSFPRDSSNLDLSSPTHIVRYEVSYLHLLEPRAYTQEPPPTVQVFTPPSLICLSLEHTQRAHTLNTQNTRVNTLNTR